MGYSRSFNVAFFVFDDGFEIRWSWWYRCSLYDRKWHHFAIATGSNHTSKQGLVKFEARWSRRVRVSKLLFLDQVSGCPQRRPNHRIAVINCRYYGCSWSVHGRYAYQGGMRHGRSVRLRGYHFNSACAAQKSEEGLSIILVFIERL